MNVTRLQLVERQQQALLLERLAERGERIARAQDDVYDGLVRESNRLEQQKDRTIWAGLGLIVAGVSCVPLASAVSPVLLVAGLACGAGVLWSLRRHKSLIERQDSLSAGRNQAMALKSDFLGKTLEWYEQRRQLVPILADLERAVAEEAQLALMAAGGPTGGAVGHQAGRLVVGGVALRPKRAASE